MDFRGILPVRFGPCFGVTKHDGHDHFVGRWQPQQKWIDPFCSTYKVRVRLADLSWHRPFADLQGCTVVLATDAIVIGSSMEAGIRVARAMGVGRMVVATPGVQGGPARPTLTTSTTRCKQSFCPALGCNLSSFRQLSCGFLTRRKFLVADNPHENGEWALARGSALALSRWRADATRGMEAGAG